MKGKIDITLNSQSLDALDIPNPQKRKNMTVPCITQQAVEITLETLEIEMISSVVLTNKDEVTRIHTIFNAARKELGITPNEERNHG